MRSASDRITSRVLCGLVLCGFAGLAAIDCTKAQIEPLDASGQAGASGGSGGSGGASAGGRGGGASAGTGGAAGSTAGAGGTDAGGRGGGGATGAAGAAGTTGSAGAGGGRGGMGGSTGGAGGTGPGGAGGLAGSGAGGTMTGGRGGAGGAAAGTTGSGGSGGSAAGTTGSGGAAGTTGSGGSGGSAAGATGAGGSAAGSSGSGGSGGTGGASVTPTVAGQIVVTELMHDTDVVGDDFGEWFELYNPSDTISYDLYGCQIRDLANAHTIAAHLTLPPHAFRTLAIFATGGGFVPDYTYSGVKFDNNAGDEVNIYCGGTLIDRFAYSASLATVSGHAFSVDPAHYTAVDNDNPSNYCLAQDVYNQSTSGSNIIRDYGTPGVTNPSCP